MSPRVAFLPLDRRVQAEAENRHVRAFGGGHRLRDAIPGPRLGRGFLARQLASPCVDHAGPPFQFPAQRLQRRHVAGGLAIVIALQRRRFLRVRPDDRHRPEAIRVERQQAVVL